MKHDNVTPYGESGKSKKQEVEAMFDNIAGSYDFLNHLFSMGIDNLWRRKAVKYIGQNQPKQIIDIATGTGDFAFESLRLKPSRIVGLDLSEEMLNVGRKKATKKKNGAIVEFVKGDSEQLHFTDNEFDAMTVGFGVRNYQNLKQGLSEMHRILRPGGRLAILEVSEPTAFPVKQLFGLYFHHIMPFFGRLISKDDRAYSYLPESVEAFPEGHDFIKVLDEVGFKHTKWTPLTFGTCAMYTCEK